MYTLQVDIDDALIESRYQHVHHADALRLLERARVGFLEQIGFPLERFLDAGLFLVITRVDIRYLRELVRGRVDVICENPRVDGKTLFLSQRIVNDRQKASVEAEVESKILSRTLGRAVLPEAGFAAAFLAG